MGEELIMLKPCIICSRLSVSADDDDQNDLDLKRFLRLLGRCLNLEQETTEDGVVMKPMWLFQFEKLIQAGMYCCGECSKVVESFCQLYEQLKSTEVMLNWKLGRLKELMSTAEKEPARMKDFRETAKQLGMVPDETVEFVVKFKRVIVEKCDWEMQATFPRLKLRRHQPGSEVVATPHEEEHEPSGFEHGIPYHLPSQPFTYKVLEFFF